MYDRVFVVAAYSPPGNSGLSNLGASKKIESVIRILKTLNKRIVLINSAHNREEFRRTRVGREIVGGVSTIVITPFTLPNRKLGKLLNLFYAFYCAWRFSGRPKKKLVWCYNGYSFECLFALFIAEPKQIVVEMEDMPFSRKRGRFDIKDRLDNFLLGILAHKVQLVTCVNQAIADYFSALPANKILFPSVINQKLASQSFNAPFSRDSRTIGYFGGLNQEKGADVMLELVRELPAYWRVIVTGGGVLTPDFIALAAQYPGKLTFGQNVSEEQLHRYMHECDVLVNPHKPIADMGNGVFPFKVYEYLYTRRLVLTTKLPAECEVIESALEFFDGSVQALKAKLIDAEAIYMNRRSNINDAADYIAENFSEKGFATSVIRSLKI